MMESITQREEEIIENFEFLQDWEDKYNFIIEAGKEMENMTLEDKKKSKLISGCQSQVWLMAFTEGDRARFKADSDALITKGIIALLIRVLDNQKPEDILHAKLEFVDKIGLKNHLSPTRSNGLVAMIKQIKVFALAFQTKFEQNN